jgi:hypothetical protein
MHDLDVGKWLHFILPFANT